MGFSSAPRPWTCPPLPPPPPTPESVVGCELIRMKLPVGDGNTTAVRESMFGPWIYICGDPYVMLHDTWIPKRRPCTVQSAARESRPAV